MSKEELKLPDEITPAVNTAPRDLIIISIPKMGKSTILGHFTTTHNAIVFDLEKGGFEYVPARKLTIYPSHDTTRWEGYQNYIKYRKLLLDNKGKYDYLLVDGFTDLDNLSEVGGTMAYMSSIIGKKFNRKNGIPDGEKLEYDDPEWKSVLTLPDGGGYNYTRNWLLQQIEFFKIISPYRIYAAHVADKYIKEGGKEEVIGSEIFLTGKLKTIVASKVTALCKLIADGDDRYLNFDVQNDSIIAGSRSPILHGKLPISKLTKEGKLETFWDKIYG
jgi:hypothetical protein